MFFAKQGKFAIFSFIITIILSSNLISQDEFLKPEKPKNLKAYDYPNDSGGVVYLIWDVDTLTQKFNDESKPFNDKIESLEFKILRLQKEKNKLFQIKNEKIIDLIKLEGEKNNRKTAKEKLNKEIEERIESFSKNPNLNDLPNFVKDLKNLEAKILEFNVFADKYNELYKKVKDDFESVKSSQRYRDLEEKIKDMAQEIGEIKNDMERLSAKYPPIFYDVLISETKDDFIQIDSLDSRTDYAEDDENDFQKGYAENVNLPFWAWNRTNKKLVVKIKLKKQYFRKFFKLRVEKEVEKEKITIETTMEKFMQEKEEYESKFDQILLLSEVANKIKSDPNSLFDSKLQELQQLISKLNDIISKNFDKFSSEASEFLDTFEEEKAKLTSKIAEYNSLQKLVEMKFEEEYKKNEKKEFSFKIVAKRGDDSVESQTVSASAKGNFFNFANLNNFLYMMAFSIVVLAFITLAKRKQLFLRKIPGLDALDEAVGRATELGKPVYYLTGRDDISSISTIAATTILGEVAKKVCEYGISLKVPHTYPITMAVSQEITREAYIRAGKPDAYSSDINFFVTEDQFGYTAAVDGMFVREKPGAIIYMGFYYAESLLLAETGAAVGAIQIAGTDADHQLPFFFAACDYTLIGEELYVASAYLSRDPILLGTIRGQDAGKLVLLVIIFIGSILATVGVLMDKKEITDKIIEVFSSF